MRHFLFALSLIAAVPLAAQQFTVTQSPMVKENATVKLSDHVYAIPDESVPLVPNVGIVVGNTATLVVETGLGPRNAEAILREVAKVSKNTNLFLVTTHYHPEHAAGSSAFPANTKFVVSDVQQKDIDELGLTTNTQFAGFSPAVADLLKDVRFRRPDVVFEREHTLDLGGLRVRLLSPGPMHTRGDTLAFVEGDRVLFAGDVVMNKTFLAFSQYSNAQTWIDVLGRLEPLGATKIVPAHGAIGDGSLIAQQRTVLLGLQTRVRELKGQGKTVDETAQFLVAESRTKYPDWVGPNRVTGIVRALYADAR